MPVSSAVGVRRVVLGPAALAGVTVAALVAGLWLRPDRGVPLLHGAAAVLTGLVLWAITRLVRAAYPPWSGPGQTPAPAAPPSTPARLEQLERYVRFSISNGFDCHVHVRPLLRDAARRRLAERHRVDLDRDPDRARALLGEPAWELLAPDRPEPDRTAAGWRPEALAAVIRRVEDL
jgi:hypothetical protein